jgi:hypothetical protein|tara:strand:- start:96 stop:605 length:510 start_codon:yes stop_codon:yes gene_type:complete
MVTKAYETVVSTTNLDTGEVKQESSVVQFTHGKEPPYVKMYLDDLCALKHVPKAKRALLEMLLKKLDYDGYINLSPRYRDILCKQLGIKPQSLRNSIMDLCKAKLIKNVSTNEFSVNPYYFAKGDWKTVVEQRRNFHLTVAYNANGTRTISTDVSYFGGDQDKQTEMPL